MSRLLDPGVLAILAMVAAVALIDSGYGWVPIVMWTLYVLGAFIYAKGRDDERFDRDHPKNRRP